MITRRRVLKLFSAAACVVGGGCPAQSQAENASALTGRLQTLYLRPTSFSGNDLRHPLRIDPRADLVSAKRAYGERPMDPEAARSVAVLAEQLGQPDADTVWEELLALLEPQLKTAPGDRKLLQGQMECLIALGKPTEALRASAALSKLGTPSAPELVLLGDARLAAADERWRALIADQRAGKPADSRAARGVVDQLTAAENAYDQAVQSDPSFAPARGARLAFRLARPLILALLKAPGIPKAAEPTAGEMIQEILELALRNPGQVAPLWHAAHCTASPPFADFKLTAAERQLLDAAMDRCRPAPTEAAFLEEARAFLAISENRWTVARPLLEGVLERSPQRSSADEWLGYVDTHSGENPKSLTPRLEARRRARAGSAAVWCALGICLAQENRLKAVDALRKSLAADVNHMSARYNLGVLLLQLNPDDAEGRHHLQLVWEEGPDDREVQFAGLVTRALNGDRAAAIAGLKELIQIGQLDSGLRARAVATLKGLQPAALPKGG